MRMEEKSLTRNGGELHTVLLLLFALLLSRKNSVNEFQYEKDWWEHVMEYSKEISSLGNSDPSTPIIEDTKKVLKNVEEIFYADKYSETWIPEHLLDCLPTVHTRLADIQEELVAIKAVENDHKYWEVIAWALAVGWLDVVKLLRLHGSYPHDQLVSREIENGLEQAVALLISHIPRMRSDLPAACATSAS